MHDLLWHTVLYLWPSSSFSPSPKTICNIIPNANAKPIPNANPNPNPNPIHNPNPNPIPNPNPNPNPIPIIRAAGCVLNQMLLKSFSIRSE